MRPSLAIGDFSRATHLSIKTLRHYHRIGLLEPADVDPGTGHRRYTTDQIATAQVIRRFRSLDMPLEEIQAVIKAPDLATRNALISGHLSRLEATLARTQEAAASLRELLQPPADCAPGIIEHRQMAATPAAAVREMLDLEDATSWFQGALGELYGIAAAQKLTLSGQPAASSPATCSPTNGAKPPFTFPALNHPAPPGELPRSSSRRSNSLSSPIRLPSGRRSLLRVARGLRGGTRPGRGGPLREFYVVGSHETADQTLWRTEIGWPIFQTGPSPSSPN